MVGRFLEITVNYQVNVTAWLAATHDQLSKLSQIVIPYIRIFWNSLKLSVYYIGSWHELTPLAVVGKKRFREG